MAALKRGGMNGVSWWPSTTTLLSLATQTTEHNISRSPWRGGKGDLVREYADAAKKHGLRFGIYCSPWDRNSAAYGTPAYLPIYHGQLRELLTRYGTLFEVWFDGANGGDGYYGGAREKRNIDRFTYYDWPATWGLVRQLQPSACIFGDSAGLPLVGNEKGFAAEECWATFTPKGQTDPARPANGDSMNHIEGPAGHRDGIAWIPAECDVPLRKGWFWHPNEDATVRSPAQLMAIYFNSVGKGGCMNLGVAPDRDGGCARPTSARWTRSAACCARSSERLARGAVAPRPRACRTGSGPGRSATYAPSPVLTETGTVFWSTDDGVTNAS